MEKSNEYLLKEFELLRKVYDESAKETRILERYSLLTSVAIWSWYLTSVDKPDNTFLIWIPAIVTLLLGLRAWGIYVYMISVKEYITKVEIAYELPENLGWELNSKHHLPPLRVITAFVFWIALQALTIIVAVEFN